MCINAAEEYEYRMSDGSDYGVALLMAGQKYRPTVGGRGYNKALYVVFLLFCCMCYMNSARHLLDVKTLRILE